MGSGEKWKYRMKTRITTTSFCGSCQWRSFFVFFQAFHRLRQGDPLSPLPFIVVIKGLNAMLTRTRECGLFRGLRVEWVTGLRR